jgi:DNA-binding XRE family transcriptional regulator
MNQISPIAETPDSVTLRRVDFEALIAIAEDAIDNAAIDARERIETQIGIEAARADYLSGALVDRLLDGESPVRIWREHRGLTARTLAARSGVSASYLCEIETGRKPGSSSALHAIAQALHVPMDTLVSS